MKKEYVRLTEFIRRQSTFRKIVVIFAISMATVAASYLSFSASRRQGIENLQKETESQLINFNLRVSAPVDKYAYLPKLVSNYKLIADVLREPQDMEGIHNANTLLSMLNADAGSNLIYLIDLHGKTIASSNWDQPDSLVGNNYAYRPYFVDALRKGQGLFYAMGITTRAPGYFMSKLVRDADNKPLGVVTVKIDMTDLDRGWEKITHEMMVTDENGVVFLSSQNEWKYRPLWPLTVSAIDELKRTRQYDGVLKQQLPIRLIETLRPGEQIVSIFQPKENERGDEWISYFLKSTRLQRSDWTINILTPLTDIEEQARHAATGIVGVSAILVLAFMYLAQIVIRNREREESRQALESAHQALEQKHRDLQVLSEELRIQSITDPLTGVYNRRFFMESIAAMVSSANRHRHALSVIMLDVDHFKQVNDLHGHPAGDKVLRTMAVFCKEELRDADMLARYGGEEFIIALPYSDTQAVQLVAERIRIRVMSHPVDVNGESLSITVSIGISQLHVGEQNIEDTIKRADDALYESKKSGRNRVVVR